jgi:hypothetical protein
MIEEGSKESLARRENMSITVKLQTKIPKMIFFQKNIFYILDEKNNGKNIIICINPHKYY